MSAGRSDVGSWQDVRDTATRTEDWASRQLSPWEALLDASLRLVSSHPLGGAEAVDAVIKYCKVPTPSSALKKMDLDRRISLLFRVAPQRIVGALAHLGGPEFPVDLFAQGLSDRLQRNVSQEDVQQHERDASEWDGWKSLKACPIWSNTSTNVISYVNPHANGHDNVNAIVPPNVTANDSVSVITDVTAVATTGAHDSSSADVSVGVSADVPADASVIAPPSGSVIVSDSDSSVVNGDVIVGVPGNEHTGVTPCVYSHVHPDASDDVPVSENNTVANDDPAIAPVPVSSEETTLVSTVATNDVNDGGPPGADVHVPTGAATSVSEGAPNIGGDLVDTAGSISRSHTLIPDGEGRGRGGAGRPRHQTWDSELGVDQIRSRLNVDYTTGYANAYFMAQAKSAALPQIQTVWRATERPTWYYHKPHAGLVSAIAEVIGIPHKSPVGIMMLTTGLQILVASVPQIAKILRAKDGSLAHHGIPDVVRPDIATPALTALLSAQLAEEVGISTLPASIRKLNAWSTKGHRDNWTMPKPLNVAIREVARELRLEESAIANLALSAGVHAYEHRLAPFRGSSAT